ncbi:hypothetical protein [Aquabacter spiritensis]|uniref:HAMP domain-containing protein n=1 Tax=Aquabacter spiritensis TaxID=933073 RepID=A0A4R3M6U8_9HYPH|nr:hypothetical protein [Aquabacter spiritensis]TCT07989.1 hypothetical protein EDC64_101508 [Aquabacter spiritensis]
MSGEAPAPGRDRLLCAVFAFLVVLLVGGAAGFAVVSGFKGRVEEAARRDAKIIGQTVARSLAAQFEKAARYGIPLKLLPGVETYLADTMARTPGLTRIVLRGPDGREIRSAIGPQPGTDTLVAPILVDGISMGQVDVGTTPATLSSVLHALLSRTVAVVLVCALVAGATAAVFAGRLLARGRAQLEAALAASAAGSPEDVPSAREPAGGSIAAASAALAAGERRLAAKRATFLAYSEELLTVDFDGRLRADIERIKREALARAPQPLRDP